MGQTQDTITRREWKQLQSWERSQIEALLKARHSIREIAQLLGRDRRTIQREVRKGTVQQLDGDYRDVWRYFGDAGQRALQVLRAGVDSRAGSLVDHHGKRSEKSTPKRALTSLGVSVIMISPKYSLTGLSATLYIISSEYPWRSRAGGSRIKRHCQSAVHPGIIFPFRTARFAHLRLKGTGSPSTSEEIHNPAEEF